MPGGHVAALYQNELYELVYGRGGTARLMNFGVIFGTDRVVLYWEPAFGGNLIFNSVVGIVMRYSTTPVRSNKSNLPPTLGGPSCPPRNMTDRSATVPLAGRPSLIHCQRPDSSLVGEPMAKCIVTVRVDDPSPNLASASRRSPSRVPRISPRVNEDRSSRRLRSSTDGLDDLAHEVRRTMTQQNDKCPSAVLRVIFLCSRDNGEPTSPEEQLHRHSQLDRVIRCVNQILLGSQVPFSCLHRRVGLPVPSTPDSQNPQWITTVAIAGSPLVSISPSSITFPDTLVGNLSPLQTVTVTNTGASPAAIQSATLSGDFLMNSQCPASLAPSASCSVYLNFLPQATGQHAGTLTITSNTAGSPFMVALSGTGIVPAISVSPAAAFPSTAVGSASAVQTITVTSSGTAQLLLSAILSSSAEFNQSNNCLVRSMAPGQTCTISAVFTPSALGSRSAQITITGNQASGPVTIPLAGSGFMTVEAEAPGNILRGKARVDACMLCSGGAMVDRLDASGSMSVSGFPAATRGPYTFTGAFVNSSSKPASVSIGVNASAPQVITVPTGTGLQIVSFPLTLEAGSNSIKVSNASTSALGVDLIRLN